MGDDNTLEISVLYWEAWTSAFKRLDYVEIKTYNQNTSYCIPYYLHVLLESLQADSIVSLLIAAISLS